MGMLNPHSMGFMAILYSCVTTVSPRNRGF